jgi:hypothetical protein
MNEQLRVNTRSMTSYSPGNCPVLPIATPVPM